MSAHHARAMLATASLACTATPPADTTSGDTTAATGPSGTSPDADSTATTTMLPTDGTGTTTSSSTTTDPDTTGTTGEPPAAVRYDQVRQKSAHNSYQRDEALFDQLVYHRVRSIELDIHVGKTFEPTTDGVWYVYHTDVTDDETWCVRLGHCLDAVAAFTEAAVDHEVVTLWIDLKDPFDAGHGPAELDAALGAAFGEAIVSGPELLALSGCGDAASVQQGLTDPACGWPTLEALRGRVIVVLTGGAGVLREYHDDDPTARRALVAPALVDPTDAPDWPHTAFVNFAAQDTAAVPAFVEAGFVARVWDCNDEPAWDDAVAAGAHHVATDMVSAHADPWARTHDDRGWPFSCIDACDMEDPPEEAPVVGLDVESGDVWGTADSAWFLHDDVAADPDGTWQAFVSTPNSHVEPFAKACLMARASLDPGAPYFAVCRPADDEPLRIQWRSSAGGDSSDVEHDITADNTLDPPGAAFVRLRVDQGGTCVAGDGSADGTDWVEIGGRCFAEPLPLQGVSASAHDAGPVRLLLGDLVRDRVPHRVGDFAASAAIGGASADVYDGVLP